MLDGAAAMVGQPGFFDMSDRLWELSAKGDGLARIAALVKFERFRPELEQAVPAATAARAAARPSPMC
jgi:hypothetical protein